MQESLGLAGSLRSIGSPYILTIGDLMLDRYSWGSVERISPEAPIPILKIKSEDSRLGGAANVVANLSKLGSQSIACGAVGSDDAGQELISLVKNCGALTDGIFIEPKLRTICKHRMLSGQHHLLRMDFDPQANWNLTQAPYLLDFLKQKIPHCSAIVVSDYAKGTLQESILQELRKASDCGAMILLDPPFISDYSAYKGFYLIKPNRYEAQLATGLEIGHLGDAEKAAKILREKYGFQYVVVSLDQDGMLLSGKECSQFFESEAKEIFDVVGAGDMVISVLAFMLGGGAKIEQATFWANFAAGMEIEHVGVVPLSKNQLLQKLERGTASEKIASLEALQQHLSQANCPVILTSGYFDRLSAGQLKFLQGLAQFEGEHVVALNSDFSVVSKKGEPPTVNERERAALVAALESVDWVVMFDELTPAKLVLELKPSIVVKGESYRHQPIAELSEIQAVGAKLEYLPEY